MKRSISFALLAVSSLTASAMAEVMNFRTFPSCAYASKQIYCFGGYVDKDLDEKLYSLDISQFEGNSTSLMYSSWNVVFYDRPFDIEKGRIQPGVITVGDGKQILVQGGYNKFGSKLANNTILYDAPTRTWQTLPPYSGSDKIVRDIYLGCVVDMGGNNYGFYGGIEENTSGLVDRKIGDVTIPQKNSTRVNIGYIPLQIFNIQTKIWNEFSPQNNAPYAFYPNSQGVAMNPADGKIYYLGGSYYTPESEDTITYDTRFPFSQAIVFDSRGGSWSYSNFTGDVPTNRIYQTVTMVPNSDIVFLYGGSDDGGNKAATSYCYSLNLTTNKWANQVTNVGVPDGKNGPRFSHAAVLVDTTLFILFGRGLSGGFPDNSILTLDLSNPSNIHYTDIYMANANINPNTNVSTNTNDKTTDTANSANSTLTGNSEGLSKGAIGGIAAGSVVGGLAVIALIGFCIWRKKRDETKNNQPVDSQEVEAMQIDWDKVEDHFTEIPVSNSLPNNTSAVIIPDQQFKSNIHAFDDDVANTANTNSPLTGTATLTDSSSGSVREMGQHIAGSTTNIIKPSSPLTEDGNPQVSIGVTKPDGA